MASNGNVAGYFAESGGGTSGYLRTTDGTATIIDTTNAIQGAAGGTAVSAINSAGALAGTYYGTDLLIHTFFRSPSGQYSVIAGVRYTYYPGQPGFPFSGYATALIPVAINDAGAIAGFFYDPNEGIHSFIFPAQGLPTAFDAPAAGSGPFLGTQVQALSSTGDAIGFYTDAKAVYHGFIRHSDGTFTVLDVPGLSGTARTGTSAKWISADGSVVGSVIESQTSRSFVRTPDGSYTVFDPPVAGLTWSVAIAINASGAIVGIFRDANSIPHGYLRSPDGTFTIIDDPNAAQIPDFRGTGITGFNDAGIIVGLYSDSKDVAHGYIRQ